MCLQCVERADKVMKQLATLYWNAKKTCSIAISMLEARQGGADDSLGPMWKAGL